MTMLIEAVGKSGLNRAAIMDALRAYGAHTYEGVAGDAKFDYTLNNIAPVKLARVEHGKFVYGTPYAQIDRSGVNYRGPGREPANDLAGQTVVIGFVGPLQSATLTEFKEAIASENRRGFPNRRTLVLSAVEEGAQWGGVSGEIAHLALAENALVLVTASKRETAHETVQIANKIGLPVLTLAADSTLNQVNIPWIFRLPLTPTLQPPSI